MTAGRSHFLENKKIIVAGSGIAGLSFVTALRKQWDPSLTPPEIVVYDRDSKEINAQREGYSLSLNGIDADGGLVALRDLGLLDRVLERSVLGTDSSQSFRLWDSSWADIMQVRMKPHRGVPVAGIRIHRRDLRSILIEAGEGASSINWGTSCVAAERLDSGRIRVRLSGPDGGGGDGDGDGDNGGGERAQQQQKTRHDECDLLIAADGANSKIRGSLRPDDTLQYAGAVQMGGLARFPQGIPPPIDRNWGMVVTGRGVACFFSPVDKTGVVWGLSRLEPEPRARREASPENFAALMRESLEIGHMMAEPYPTIVRATTQEAFFMFPARDKPPFRHDGTAPGVVFIGDSNHAVSPFAGNGANLALKDGWDLAARLCGSASLEAAVEAYDELALPRAVKMLRTSHDRIAFAHYTGIKYYVFRVALWFGSWLMWLSGK